MYSGVTVLYKHAGVGLCGDFKDECFTDIKYLTSPIQRLVIGWFVAGLFYMNMQAGGLECWGGSGMLIGVRGERVLESEHQNGSVFYAHVSV